ncbi:LacI family transcriptional regulator [Marmoricola endophyticus]|uniref:LacI family transcriptional regulator n=1 Tax=Marmoricola endophyticus TaxID=2040280 RepID=A0A917BLS6_9ACTN|nr:ABC transporter substrate-binding protein [Marmoricola endophyticus]GGF51095.1 LacI family transcriptional regulator [Marmoricola endophyticus]
MSARAPRLRLLLSGLAILALTGTAAACGKAEDTGGGSSDSSAAQQVVEPADQNGAQCDLTQYGGGVKKLDLKDATVGFSQSEKEDNPFRIAETKSIGDAAKKAGVKKYIHTNAQTQLSKQISDIQDMLAQGVDALIVAPLNSDGLEPALNAAKAKGVPVLTVDRKLTSGACDTYVSFLGSNFTEQGQRAADQLIKGTGGKAKVAILLGASGNNVTTERTKGFVDEIKAKGSGIDIVAQQTGEFARDKGQQVTEQLLQSNPDITAIYAENDEMGLGALAAIQGSGKQAGKDVQIYSVDGTRNAVQEIVNGDYNGVVESNPRFGPLAFQTLEQFLSGEKVYENIVIKDTEYDPDNAEDGLSSAF